MPDCYLCGDYIERGQGHRRHVHTETSTRIYFTRHGGGSWGARKALRTVCRTCAAINDRIESGGWLRTLLYLLGYGVSFWTGWQLIFVSSVEPGWMGWLGLACLLGIPPLLIGALLGNLRVKMIARSVSRQQSFDLGTTPWLARHSSETVDDWLDRVLPILNVSREKEREFCSWARACAPEPGELLGDWFRRIPDYID